MSLQYCERSAAVVLVLYDGSCALLNVPASGLGAGGGGLEELSFSHWVSGEPTLLEAAHRTHSMSHTQMGGTDGGLPC